MMESVARERERNVEWVVKAVRESVAISEDEALELGVIDLVANSRTELLAALEGREVKVAGETRTLALAGLPVRPLEMTILQRLFNFLADPNVAVDYLVRAAEQYERALQIFEQILGPEHPSTRLVRSNLERLGEKGKR